MADPRPIRDRTLELRDRAVRKLVESHARSSEEPLLLAVRYRLDDDADIYLLEVLDGFPGEDDDPPLATELEATRDLLITGKLHLTLASPAQLRSAIERGDALVDEVRRDSVVEHQAYGADELAKALHARPRGVTGRQQRARLEIVKTFDAEDRATPEETEALRRKWLG